MTQFYKCHCENTTPADEIPLLDESSGRINMRWKASDGAFSTNSGDRKQVGKKTNLVLGGDSDRLVTLWFKYFTKIL